MTKNTIVSVFYEVPEKPNAPATKPKESITALTEEQKMLADTLARLSSVGGRAEISLSCDYTSTNPGDEVGGSDTVIGTNDGKGIIYMRIVSRNLSKDNLLNGAPPGAKQTDTQVDGGRSFMISLDPKNPRNIQVTGLSSPLVLEETDQPTDDVTRFQETLEAGPILSVSKEELAPLLKKIENIIIAQEAANTADRRMYLNQLQGEVNK